MSRETQTVLYFVVTLLFIAVVITISVIRGKKIREENSKNTAKPRGFRIDQDAEEFLYHGDPLELTNFVFSRDFNVTKVKVELDGQVSPLDCQITTPNWTGRFCLSGEENGVPIYRFQLVTTKTDRHGFLKDSNLLDFVVEVIERGIAKLDPDAKYRNVPIKVKHTLG